MASSLQNKEKLFCPIRKIWVPALPEEKVRASLLATMTGRWGFPPHLLMVEKGLRELPLARHFPRLPIRRFDIVAYAESRGTLKPLLVIECKRQTISEKAARQLLGYNYYFRAPFVAVAAAQKFLCWHAANFERLEREAEYKVLIELAKF
jgi:hypothetical protein